MPYFKQITMLSLLMLFAFVPYVTFAGKPLKNKTIPVEKEIMDEKQTDMQEIITDFANKIEKGELDLQDYKDIQEAVTINYERLEHSKTTMMKNVRKLMTLITIFFIVISIMLFSVKLLFN